MKHLKRRSEERQAEHMDGHLRYEEEENPVKGTREQ